VVCLFTIAVYFVPTISEINGRQITNPVEMANNLNTYYACVISLERYVKEINAARLYEPFTIQISIIRKCLAMCGRKDQ
jgi:hypothetical protein